MIKLSRFKKRSMLFKITWISLFSILLLNAILYIIQPFDSDTILKYYTSGYFSSVASFLHIAFGFSYFSIGDIIYIAVGTYIIFQIIYFFFSLITAKFNRLGYISLKVLTSFLFIFLLLNLQWNWNYSQPSLEEKMNLDSSDYSVEELADFTSNLIKETKEYKDNSNFKVFDVNNNSIIDISELGYKELAKHDKFFDYEHPSVKYSLFSSLLPYLGISGYYNPFTAEAQITKGIPIVQIPFVVNHEIAHQLGIASEAEANFIGYLACINNPLTTIKYSGDLNLLMYCLSDLRKREYTDYDKIVESIPKNIKEDINEISLFWSGYRNKYRKHFDSGYDKFLKNNNQKDGLDSYNKVVSLAIFYNRKN